MEAELLEFFHKKHQGRALLVHSLTPIQNSNASILFMMTLFVQVLQFEPPPYLQTRYIHRAFYTCSFLMEHKTRNIFA